MTPTCWERIILDAAPPAKMLAGCAVGDLDNDGHAEIIVGGAGALLWYRPDTFEKGKIADGHFVVGLTLEDLDGDGAQEVVASHQDTTTQVWSLRWYKPGATLHEPWTAHVLDPLCNGNGHDVIFADVDKDGRRECIANAAYCDVPGVFLYKPGADVAQPWQKHTVSTDVFSEGLRAADLDGDGRVEIVHGPDWYSQPAGGPYAGPWLRHTFAPSFREMSRTALLDLTGNGRPDIVICESEYVDGKLSWFVNRMVEDPANPWVEHEIHGFLNFAHSLDVWTDGSGAHIFVAEMNAGGWSAPYNWQARLMQFTSANHGHSWQCELLDQGMGTHQAVMYDVDGDGEREVVGKEWGMAHKVPRVQLWKKRAQASPLAANWRHSFIDRDKPMSGTDITPADIDGDGLDDVVCVRWWYKNPTWERRLIPDIGQVLTAYDIDGDGTDELICTRYDSNHPRGFSADFCWVKAIDPLNNQWQQFAIGKGDGDWPHGGIVAPVLPGGRLAFIPSYHSANLGEPHYPQIFEIPADPRQGLWSKRVLAEIVYGEEIVPYDLDKDGKLDLVAGAWWLENKGDGTFEPHRLADAGKVARIRVADVNGDGHPDIVFVVEHVDWKETKSAFFAPVGWIENPGDLAKTPWAVHIIDKVRSPHSVEVCDLDGDGQPEIIVGEHDPFRPYRSSSRTLIYKKADPSARAWIEYTIDNRFEHHDGTKLFSIGPGRIGIISHGWKDERYVHLWEWLGTEPT